VRRWHGDCRAIHAFRSTPPFSSGEERTSMTCSFSSRISSARERQPVKTARRSADRTAAHPAILRRPPFATRTRLSDPISSSPATQHKIQNP
jgi:hypothetical protein